MKRSIIFVVAIALGLCIVAHGVTKEEEEAEKEMKEWMQKNPEKVKQWKNLQRRACNASTTPKDAEEGLKECYVDKFNEYKGPEAEEIKKISLGANEKCKKDHPFKDFCDRKERNARFVCYKAGFEAHKVYLSKIYKKPEVKEPLKKLFQDIYACLDGKLKKKNA